MSCDPLGRLAQNGAKAPLPEPYGEVSLGRLSDHGWRQSLAMKGKCRRSESFLHLKRSTTPSYTTNRRRSPVFCFLLQQLLLCERNAIDLVNMARQPQRDDGP
jgi:hypothetical protein